jgi:hypothetical protein
LVVEKKFVILFLIIKKHNNDGDIGAVEMKIQTIENSTHKILVIGSIYDKINKLSNLDKDYDLIIVNGNICYPYDNIKQIEDRICLFQHLPNKFIYNLGNHDLEFLAKTKSDEIKNWLSSKSNVVIINFKNQTRLIVLNGGVSPKMTKQDLDNNIEVSFISKIDNEAWHSLYGGGYGYIISNQPFTNEAPKFYKYSAQIGSLYDKDTKIYAQVVDQYGLKETILI